MENWFWGIMNSWVSRAFQIFFEDFNLPIIHNSNLAITGIDGTAGMQPRFTRTIINPTMRFFFDPAKDRRLNDLLIFTV